MAQESGVPDPSLPWYIRWTRWRPTSLAEAVSAEKDLLKLCQTPFSVSEVSVGKTKKHTMHTISGGDLDAPPLVMLAGYGAGAGFYFRNLDGLARHFRVFAVDLLGTGMSGRPPFPGKDRESAERFFLDGLQQWKREQGLNKMILLGHSLGGYLAATYALQHPEDVQHVVLVCPAGLPKPPEKVAAPRWAQSPWTVRGQLFRLGTFVWNAGFTPGTVVRGLGPWGPGLVRGYARNRFREGMGLSEEEVLAFENYFYHISAASGSGEHALRHLLAPFAWAREPLEGRLHKLQVPMSLVYGEFDWMNPAAGQRICDSILEQRGRLNDCDLQFASMQQAGHYPFLDQPDVFLQKVLTQMRCYLPKAATAAGRADFEEKEARPRSETISASQKAIRQAIKDGTAAPEAQSAVL